MGDISDYYRDLGEEWEQENEFNPLNITWTTKDGKTITLGEMSPNHLKNATRLVKKRVDWLSEEERACLSVLSMMSGEMAIDQISREHDKLFQEYLESCHTLELMIKACSMRGINIDFNIL